MKSIPYYEPFKVQSSIMQYAKKETISDVYHIKYHLKRLGGNAILVYPDTLR